MKTLLLIKERVYPYLIAAVCVFLIWKYSSIDFLSSVNLNEALTAIITVTSIIIGFMGAILPVILSMKNDSKVVLYVFQKDKRRLFLKYIKSALGIGLVLIMVAIVPYFKDLFVGTTFYKVWPYVIVYTLVCFLCCTFRCLNNMLNLIFKTDEDLNIPEEKTESPAKREMDMKLREQRK